MLNRCEFIGNLGADPEIRRTQDGRPIANLRLAVSDHWKDKNTGERREKTEWIPITIFSEGLCKVAENYLRKGSKIYVSGSWQTRKWQDQSGADRYSTECVLQGFDGKIEMLDSKPSGDSGGSSYDEKPASRSNDLDDESEIPF
jgi:single-strand DNA-binding protein